MVAPLHARNPQWRRLGRLQSNQHRNPAVYAIPSHFRVLDGLFQALAVGSGGFYVISITKLQIGLQVLYVIMM
jgi:hypothetical protein